MCSQLCIVSIVTEEASIQLVKGLVDHFFGLRFVLYYNHYESFDTTLKPISPTYRALCVRVRAQSKNHVHFAMYYIHTVYNITSEVIKKLFKFFFRQDYLKAHPIPAYLEPRRMAS